MLRRYRHAGDRSADRADPDLSRASLPERRPGDRPRTASTTVRGPVRSRRDHRRRARPKPHDGELAARLHRVRAPRRPRRRLAMPAERITLAIDTTTDLEQTVEDAVRAPVRVGAEGHPPGPARRPAKRDGDARRTRSASAILETINTNVAVADETQEPGLPGHRPGRLLRAAGRALPAAPGPHRAGAARGHAPRDAGAPAALEHRAHAHPRSRPATTPATRSRTSTGSSCPTGTAWT